MKIKIKGNEAVIQEAGEDTASKFFAGVKGKIKLNTPFSKRELAIVDSFKKAKPATKKKATTKGKK